MGDYSALMRQLEEAGNEEERQEIMQQIVPILECSQHGQNNVPFHIMVSSKRLKEADRRRLRIKNSDVEYKILPMLNQDEAIREGIRVTVYGRNGKPYNMTLRRKRRSSSSVARGEGIYVLRNWSSFFRDQAFQTGDRITVWLFRQRHPRTGHLRLVIAGCQVHTV